MTSVTLFLSRFHQLLILEKTGISFSLKWETTQIYFANIIYSLEYSSEKSLFPSLIGKFNMHPNPFFI